MALLLRIVTIDLRLLATTWRTAAYFPLTAGAVLVALWPYGGSPYIPVVAALFAGLESQYANILFRSPREFEAYAIVPVPWETIILGKNIATLIATYGLYGLMSLALWYTLPERPSGPETYGGSLWIATLAFPFLHIGNQISVRKPRRRVEWSFDDVASAFVFLAMGALLSIPYFLCATLIGEPLLALPYIGGAAAFWFKFSIPRSALRVRSTINDLSLTL
jgi:hypothetical protein